jgi:hypothetical protein
MPTFISNKGLWNPAKETIGLINKSEKVIIYEGKDIQPGEPFIYKGPDREALKMLHEAGASSLGTDFRHDPEFLQAVRNQQFDSVDEYLKHIGYDEEAETKKFKERSATVKAHEVPNKVAEIKSMGGGKDFSGNKDNDVVGGFGDEKRKGADGKEK